MTQTPADAAVAQEFGIGPAAPPVAPPLPGEPPAEPGEHDQHEQEGQEPAEVPFEELPVQTQEEIRQLRRTNASMRIRLRDLERAQTKDGQQQQAPPAESPQAIRAAEERGRTAARMEFGVQLATEAARAALTGVVPEEQIDPILDRTDKTRFVLDDGSVDRDSIADFKDTYTHLVSKRPPAAVNHGRSGKAPTSKSTADQFAEALGAQLT